MKGRDDFEDLDIDGSLVLEWILKIGECGVDLSGSG
jgi:hypothetical protein